MRIRLPLGDEEKFYNELTAQILMAVEFGYKECEKGHSLIEAQMAARKAITMRGIK